MPVELQISDDLTIEDAMSADDLQLLVSVAEQTLLHLQKKDHELSIVVTTDEQIASLNEMHREIAGPTDVLSFAADPLPAEIEMEEAPYLGDLLLGYSYTLRRALENNHNPQDEFALLVVHGILHLVGYDHNTAEKQQDMWRIQRELLTMLGVQLDVPDYIHELDDQ